MNKNLYPTAEGSILITGTSSGIGYAAVKRLANTGFDIFAGVRTIEDGEKVKQLSPEKITPLILDVTHPEDIDRAADTIREQLTEKQSFLCGVISNAGVGMIAPVEYLNEDILDYQASINLLGHMRLAKTFIPLLIAGTENSGRRGRFYFVGTGAGIPSVVFPFLNIYMACKWGVEAFCQSLRLEMAITHQAVDIGMINPGFTDTAMRATTANATQNKVNMDERFGRVYGGLIQKFAEFGNHQKGTAPDTVAEAIFQSMQSIKPKYRYLVGKDSLLTYLIGKLPLRWQEKMILRIYK